MSLRSEFKAYTEAFIRLIYPSVCGLCPAVLEINEEGICHSCAESVERLRFPLPEILKEENIPYIKEAWSLYSYESPVKELLSGVKFLNKRWLLKIFRDSLREAAAAVLAETSYDCLVSVPLDHRRFMERQFNQAEIIASYFSQDTGIPARALLRKRFGTPAQSGLSKEERRVNLYGAFVSVPRTAVEGKRVLLIDDIVTTGATASEAAKVLKEAGAKSIGLLTLARTPLHAAPVTVPSPLQEIR
jgi:ComF family protein